MLFLAGILKACIRNPDPRTLFDCSQCAMYSATFCNLLKANPPTEFPCTIYRGHKKYCLKILKTFFHDKQKIVGWTKSLSTCFELKSTQMYQQNFITIYYFLLLKTKKNKKNLCDVQIMKVLNTFFPSKVGSRKTAMVLIKDCNHQTTTNILSIFWTKH